MHRNGRGRTPLPFAPTTLRRVDGRPAVSPNTLSSAGITLLRYSGLWHSNRPIEGHGNHACCDAFLVKLCCYVDKQRYLRTVGYKCHSRIFSLLDDVSTFSAPRASR